MPPTASNINLACKLLFNNWRVKMVMPKLQTVSQFSDENPAFPTGGIRWQIFNEDNNGLKESGAIVRVGRKVLINVERYFQWIESQQQEQGKALWRK